MNQALTLEVLVTAVKMKKRLRNFANEKQIILEMLFPVVLVGIKDGDALDERRMHVHSSSSQ